MESTTLVLLGRTGNGKSATGNSIIGRNAFYSWMGFSSVTSECKLEQRVWKNGRILKVVDTPGLFDTNVSKEFLEKEIVKCIELAKDGVHGVLLVLSVQNRFTDEEANVLDILQTIFGPKIVNYMVVVFTGGDKLEKKDITLEKYLENCPKNLKELLSRCNSRMVLFDNKTKLEKTKENQITKLLEKVDKIIAENDRKPYSNELFAQARASSNRQDKEKDYTEEIKRLNETMEKNKREMEEKLREKAQQLESQLTLKKHADEEREFLRAQLKQAMDTIGNLSKPPEPRRDPCTIS